MKKKNWDKTLNFIHCFFGVLQIKHTTVHLKGKAK